MARIVKVHFPYLNPEQYLNPLAWSCDVGDQLQPFPLPRRFDRLKAFARQRWRPGPAEEADLVAYPHHYYNNDTTAATARLAQRLGVPCLFFRNNDNPEPATPPYGLVYRTSIFARDMTPAERAMPDFCDDSLRNAHGQVPLLDKPDRPSLGFCGFVSTPWRCRAFRLLGHHQKAAGLEVRQAAVKHLQRAREVDFDALLRNAFWGGALHRNRWDHGKIESFRQDFERNLFRNAYNLCVRGKGNFSTRFYEVLAAGRIPVFVNTDCVLPFADRIDYRRHCVWIEEHELPRIGQIVADFHASLDADAFRQLQLDNRKLWEDWLRPEATYEHIVNDALAASRSTESPAKGESIP